MVLRSADWSETSQLVTLWTRGRGRIRGLAKGSKRWSPSAIERFSGGLELLTLGQACGVTRAGSELATITEWDLQDDCLHLRRNLEAQRVGLYVADVTVRFFEDEDPHEGLFEALVDFVTGLRSGDAGEVLLGYQWRLLKEAGYEPRVSEDVRTGEALPGGRASWFDAPSGGFTMVSEGMVDPDRWRVRAKTVGLIQRVAASESIEGAELETVKRANRLLVAYTRELLGVETETMRAVLG